MIWSKVVGIEKFDEVVDLFNLSCSPFNNFFANGILVHNCYRMEKGLRLRSIKNVVAEIKELCTRFKIKNYFFQDELFIMNKARLRELKDELNNNGLRIRFTCSARVDILDKEILDLLHECGCIYLNFGFESSSNKVLKLMNKNTTYEQNLKVLKTVYEDGRFGMGLNFIWNNLGDTIKVLKENVRLIKQYNTYYNCRTIRPTTPYPGSPLYYQLIKEGKLGGAEHFFELFKNSDLMLINLMNITDKEAYEALLEANTELILDHYTHTGEPMKEARNYIKQLRDLYSGKSLGFRGTRHYVIGGRI